MKFYSMEEAAGLLGVHRDTISRAVHAGLGTAAGKLPAVRVGRLVKIREDALDAWLSRAEVAAPVQRKRGRPRKIEGRRRAAVQPDAPTAQSR